MKKIQLIMFFTFAMCAFSFSQEIIYVSANGNDNNSGLSETEPLKTLFRAVSRAEQLNNGRVTVLGTLDVNSEVRNSRSGLFELSANSDREILITGKPDASGSEKAVLSAKGSNKNVVSLLKGNIRFEHIEISNAEGESSNEMGIFVASRLTLGQGAVVKDNSSYGILILGDDAICIIDQGEVRNNNNSGVFVAKGLLVLQNGTIAENKAVLGAGVFVASDAKFEMKGGTITNNKAERGAGVLVMNKGTFEMSEGTITRNAASIYIGGVWSQPGSKFVQGRRSRVTGNTAANTNVDVNIYRQ